jgi:hypothetical protein
VRGLTQVAHTCNPTYLRGRDQEVHQPGRKFKRFYLEKKLSQKRAGGVAQNVDPEFKPQYCKKTKKERKNSGETIS